MKIIAVLYLLVSVSVPVFAQQADQNRTNFDQKVEMSKFLLDPNPFPRLGAIAELKYLKDILKCRELIKAEKPNLDFEKYDAMVLQYPNFFKVLMIGNRTDMGYFDIHNPVFGGACHIGQVTDEVFLVFGDWSSPLEQAFQIQKEKESKKRE